MESSSIVFTDSSGKQISKEELSKSTGKFDFQIYGAEGVPEIAKQLHNQARTFGQMGDHSKAIETLLKAHELAPKWPYPLYDLAYTYLIQDDSENALKYYRLTDELAPRGFFTSKTALFTLEKEKKGEYPSGIYQLYMSLEWIDDPEVKLHN